MDEELFKTNLKLMSRFSQRYINEIQDANCSTYLYCKTDQGETNIINGANYLHSQKGALQEARRWFQELENLKNLETIYVYGLGLGYFFDAAKKWLEENKNRVIIFLEDDFALIHRFLEQDRASKMLTHPQIVVQAFKMPKKSSSLTIPQEFEWICRTFASTATMATVLKYYLESRTKETELIRMMLNILFNQIETDMSEYTEDRLLELYTNFFHNLRMIPRAYRGYHMLGAFMNIPTIICGAGSSLVKIADTIHDLKDRALIFGSGTGMNVLNKLGIIPHFGGAIDPNLESVNRIKTNYAYEVPFFYMNRFEHHALKYIHGPLIFLRTFSTHPIQNWFDQELDISESIHIDARVSTTNYLLNVSKFLGCNPILLAGVDLAYTDKSRYPKVIQTHPLDTPLQERQFKNFSIGSGRLIPLKNREGQEIFTRHDWIIEAETYTEFSKQFPGTRLLNVTQGGLPITGIENPSLEEASQEHLKEEHDLLNLVHVAIQTAGKMPITNEKLDSSLKRWKESLTSCSKICEELLKAFEKQKTDLKESKEIPSSFLTDEVSDALIKMGEEPAYLFFLKEMGEVHKKITFRTMHTSKWFPELFTEKELFLKELEFEESKAQFLLNATKLHLNILENLDLDEVESSPSSSKPHYESEPQGKPSRFFSKEGVLLAEGWFQNGKRVGKNGQFYNSGALYSLQRFKEGEWEGAQEYFYENGQKKSILNYSKGRLHGKITLFYPNGMLAKEIHFNEGNLHGTEKEWDPHGQLISESTFEANRPIGVSREWYSNGVLKTEKIFYDTPEHYDIHQWNKEGIKIKEQLFVKELGKEMLEQSKERKKALEALRKQLEGLKETDL